MFRKLLSVTLFALLLCSSLAQNYTDVDPANYNDTDIQTNMNFGIAFVINYDVNSSKISAAYGPANFSVAQYFSVQTRSISGGQDYKYNLSLLSNDNSITVNTQFAVFVDATNVTRVMSYGSVVMPTPGVVAPYVPLPVANWNDSDIQTYLNFGINATIVDAVNASRIDAGFVADNFSVQTTNSIYSQQFNGINYRFDVLLVSSDGTTYIQSIFIVYELAGAMKLTFLDYGVGFNAPPPALDDPIPGVNASNSSETSEEVASEEVASEEVASEEVASEEVASEEVASEQVSEVIVGDANYTNSSDSSEAAGYVLVPFENVSDPVIQSNMDFGIINVVNQAVNDSAIPANYSSVTFAVSHYHGVYEQNLANGTNYQYDLEILSADNAIDMNVTFIVFEDANNSTSMVNQSYVLA